MSNDVNNIFQIYYFVAEWLRFLQENYNDIHSCFNVVTVCAENIFCLRRIRYSI